MRKGKKALMALCAAAICLSSVFGTMAYLTDSDTAVNTFTVGKVEITLDEAKANKDGSLVADADRVQENEYKLLPGHTYQKDPTVHVDDKSEDSYLFVKVENEIYAIEDDTTTISVQMTAKGWKAVDGQTGLYVYVGTTAAPLAVKAGADIPVFEQFKIAGTVDNATLAGYAGKTITVTAYAVQKDGFEGQTASAIWTAAFA